MPKYDRTGPRGEGARTGRGLGDCQNVKTDNKTVDTRVVRPRVGLGRRQVKNGKSNNRGNN